MESISCPSTHISSELVHEDSKIKPVTPMSSSETLTSLLKRMFAFVGGFGLASALWCAAIVMNTKMMKPTTYIVDKNTVHFCFV